MFTDIVDLRDFYQNPLGLMTRRLLRRHIADLWPLDSMAGEKIALLGYGTPLLRPLSQRAAAVYGFMPAGQGVAYWPREGPNVSCLVDIENLPLADASIDRVIALHAIEGLASPAPMLREIWRVMKSGGRFMTIVPSRRGLWAHSDHTPFGNGQPYSPAQIKKTLHNQGFLIERVRHALYAPPSLSRFSLSLAPKIESYAARLAPGFGGVLLVEASKQLYAPTAVKAWASQRLVLPLSLPAATPQAT